jgi:hypothetical protein
MGARRLGSVAVVWVCVVLGGLVLGGASASAVDRHVFSGAFGAPCSGVPCGAGELKEPAGVAVSTSTHDVYVVDRGDDRVEQFSAAGAFIAQWNGSAAPTGVFSAPSEIAVDNSGNPLDPSAGDVYVVDTGHGAIDKFSSTGAYEGQLKETTSGVPFGGLNGVAVDANGVVWVYQGSHEIDSFSDALSNEFLSARESPYEESPGFAVDSEDNLYVRRGSGVYAKLNSTGETLIEEVHGEVSSTGVGVDLSSNDVFIGGNESGFGRGVWGFTSGGSEREHFGGEHLTGASGGVAVDSTNGTVYVADPTADAVDVFDDVVFPDVSTGAASGVGAGSATLNGAVNPDGVLVSSCSFEYGTSSAYGQTAACEETVGSGTGEVHVHADISGLSSGTVYHFRLQAGNANGMSQGQDETFTTTGPPVVGGESASVVTNHCATLEAQVDPVGLATTYHFEYGPTAAYGTSAPVPDGSVGSGFVAEPVSVEVCGLQASTTYHYRVVAVNALGTVDGADETFTTQPPALIDGASATDVTAEGVTLNAQINPLGFATTYHFEWGTTTAYGHSLPVPDATVGSGEGDVAVSQQLTGLQPDTTYHYRVAATNSLGTAFSLDHTFVYDTGGAGLPDDRAYEMVTPPQKNGARLGAGLIILPPDIAENGMRVIDTGIQCFAGASSCTGSRQSEGEPVAFTRTSGGWVASSMAPPATASPGTPFDGNSAWGYSAGADTALFGIPTPPAGEDDFYARQPDGAFLDVGPTTPPALGAIGTGPYEPEAATADLSHIVYKLNADGFWPFDATTAGTGYSLYEYAGVGNEMPVLVGVSGGPGSTDLISRCGIDLGGAGGLGGTGGPKSAYGALSADGGTVFFTARPCASGSGANAGVAVPAQTLYARIDGSRTVLISGRSPAECTSPGCLGSSPAAAEFVGASEDGSVVFFTDSQQLTDDASEGSANLYEYDFSRPVGHNLVAVSVGDTSGGGPRVQGAMAVSPDGSHVYFVAKGVLSAAANSQGQAAVDGADNLYVFERDASYPEGRVSFIATLSPSDETEWGNYAARVANVTPEGRFLVFPSAGRLTADDTSTTGAVQVFRYDAQTGELVRISIGEHGFNDNGNAGTQNAEINGLIGNHAAGYPRTDPTMSNDGAFVFFTSPVGLTPQALNEVPVEAGREQTGRLAENVYEWHEGQVYLISDGRDTSSMDGFSSVRLLGSDGTGANVFFATTDQLVPEDTDTQMDIYDARICTASEPCVAASQPPLACQGEACRGVPGGAPSLLAPASASFAGVGNLTLPAVAKPVVKAVVKAKKTKKKRKKAKPGKLARGARGRKARRGSRGGMAGKHIERGSR